MKMNTNRMILLLSILCILGGGYVLLFIRTTVGLLYGLAICFVGLFFITKYETVRKGRLEETVGFLQRRNEG